MEAILGSVAALILSIGYTEFKNKRNIEEVKAARAELNVQLEQVQKNVNDVDKEILKKSLQIIMPIAKATERLQDAVGVK